MPPEKEIIPHAQWRNQGGGKWAIAHRNFTLSEFSFLK
jgi:hypothetical protein